MQIDFTLFKKRQKKIMMANALITIKNKEQEKFLQKP